MRTSSTATALALLAAACAGPRQFRPVEQVTAVSPTGKGAAEYDAKAGEQPIGDVKVWSEGAYRGRVDGQRATILQLTLEVENPSGEDLVVEALHLDSLLLDDGRVEDLGPVEIVGPRTVAAGESARLDAYFRVPMGAEPNDIEGFTVDWTVREGETRYRDRTTFEEQLPELELPPIDGAAFRPSPALPPDLPPPPVPGQTP